MVTTLSTSPGPPAVDLLASVLAGLQRDDPLAPVTVAVPSPYAGLSLRRLLGAAGLVNVRFQPLGRVAELLGAPALAATGRRPLSTAVRSEAIRAVLAADPGVFGPVAGHPATVRALDRACAELRTCPEASLDAVAASGERAAEVVRVARATRARLADTWYDEHDLGWAAVESARHGSPALADVGAVVAYCLRALSPAMRGLLEALAGRVTVIEAEETGRPTPADLVVTCTDPDEEVRAVSRMMAERLAGGAGGPVPLHRMALLYPAARPYALIAHQELAAAGIPFNGPGVRTVAQSVTGAALLGLLRLPEDGWRRDDVMAWLAGSPILELPGSPAEAPAAAWDATSRLAGVVAGAAQWDERLASYRARLHEDRQAAMATEAGEEAEGGQVARLGAELERAERLRSFVAELVAAADPGGRSTWSELAAWATGLLERYLGRDGRHRGWPEAEVAAWDAVRQALARLGQLDAVGPGAGLATFRRAVEQELEVTTGRVGRFGEGVFVGPLRAGRAADFDVVFVVGVADGTLPCHDREDGLLPEAARAAGGGELADAATRRREQRDDYLAALAAGRRRVLLCPSGDPRRGRARLPSPWLLESAGELAGFPVFSEDLAALADAGHPAIRKVASFEAGIRGAPEPASLLDHDLRALARWTAAGGRAEGHFLAADDPRLGAGLRAARGRAGAEFTRFDGNLTESVARPLAPGGTVSPTSLELYARCPMRYFLARVLGLDEVERPEDVLSISPVDKGSLVHRVLEDYVTEVLAGHAGGLDHVLRIAEARFAEVEAAGLAGRRVLWAYERDVMRRELARVLADGPTRPLAAELAFGLDGREPVTLTLPDGRTMGFRGRADRVDDDGDGGLLVTDYKTGRSDDYEGLRHDPVMRGEKLQLPLYALAARDRFPGFERVRSRYWMIAERGEFREYPVELNDELLERTGEVVQVIVDGIEDGAFLPRPGESDRFGWRNCGYCEFDRLCQQDRDRQWEAKKSAPALAAYRALVEPAPVEGGRNGTGDAAGGDDA